jgi:hypothetical protein
MCVFTLRFEERVKLSGEGKHARLPVLCGADFKAD